MAESLQKEQMMTWQGEHGEKRKAAEEITRQQLLLLLQLTMAAARMSPRLRPPRLLWRRPHCTARKICRRAAAAAAVMTVKEKKEVSKEKVKAKSIIIITEEKEGEAQAMAMRTRPIKVVVVEVRRRRQLDRNAVQLREVSGDLLAQPNPPSSRRHRPSSTGSPAAPPEHPLAHPGTTSRSKPPRGWCRQCKPRTCPRASNRQGER